MASNGKGLEDAHYSELQSNYDEVTDSFEAMNLKPDLLRGIRSCGFKRPFAIQQRAIMPIINDRDVIAQAQFDAGKTTTFSISALQKIDPRVKACQCLIVAHTREMALQIRRDAIGISGFMDIECCACIGGTSIHDDMEALRRGPQLVVGTPGRIYDLMQRQTFQTKEIKLFILDEADEMLSRGFTDQVHTILHLLPKCTQFVLHSATIPQDVLEVTTEFMRNPAILLVRNEELPLEDIKQFYIALQREEWKLDTLTDLYEVVPITQVVIFCDAHKVDWLTHNLTTRDFSVSAIYGDMKQSQRDGIMKEFISGTSRALITTDLLDRDIDFQVSLVINYGLPANPENYIRRIGRGGCLGSKGVAINFITPDDIDSIPVIKRLYGAQIDDMPENISDIIRSSQPPNA
ncbi:ATP-dependent RNA helicase eIF4A [Penicillium waksmanii]|uniref:ATP-dependent RNA helicase eIF4A n=1 Tax=Penicillium waksmanii TaxID=69791 RepID=UPI0025466BF0|nr:ATP-dependent RNA helicase eIF4A [Penicillium waksmanii]KAJ5984233.1 ATP-dependent RNA helicase eIF4A [Penicillium waksmanii]